MRVQEPVAEAELDAELADRAERILDPVSVREDLLDRRDAPSDDIGRNRVEQLVAAREMAIDGRAAEAGRIGDLLHARLRIIGQQSGRGIDDRLPVLHRIAALHRLRFHSQTDDMGASRVPA